MNPNELHFSDDDAERPDDRPTEVPEISIERDDAPAGALVVRPRRRLSMRAKSLIAFGCVAVLAFAGLALWHFRYDLLPPDFPVAVSDSENISRLETAPVGQATGTALLRDSLLGVALELYPLDGLRVSLEKEYPDTTDRSLVLFCRSADYRPDSTVIGTVVVDGETIRDKARRSRPAYVAVSPEGKAVVGASLSDRVPDYIARRGGSFFRQYMLLSDGTLPAQFALHGKVERAAIGRMADNRLYYVVTTHRETMYDFADAMREYGFLDAVYITGGNSYCFYRDESGNSYSTPATDAKLAEKSGTRPPAPLLVFRAAR